MLTVASLSSLLRGLLSCGRIASSNGMFARALSMLALGLTAAAPALAQAPAPAQEWPAVELAPGVVFAADGSVEIEAGPGGVPVVTFWRPVLFREESKYPVGGRMDCRVVAATQGYSDAAFDLEATYEAEKSQRKREGHIEEDRARAYDGDVRELDIITRRRKPHDHHVLSYRDQARYAARPDSSQLFLRPWL